MLKTVNCENKVQSVILHFSGETTSDQPTTNHQGHHISTFLMRCTNGRGASSFDWLETMNLRFRISVVTSDWMKVPMEKKTMDLVLAGDFKFEFRSSSPVMVG